MGSRESSRDRSKGGTIRSPLCSCRVTSHHRNSDFTRNTESSAWNFRSTELEDGIERKGRAVFTRRREVGKAAGWACRRQTNPVVPADRDNGIVGQPHRLPAGDAPALQRIDELSLCALFECTGPIAQV